MHIPMHELTGRSVTIYGQTEVVKDLIEARMDGGAPLLFDAEDVQFDGLETDEPLVRYRQMVAKPMSCVRTSSPAVTAFTASAASRFPRASCSCGSATIRSRWLGILARVAPSAPELVYSRNQRGFALLSMRSPEISRLYLQVDPSEDIPTWPDARIWDELQQRLATPGWELEEGPIFDKSITPMRSFVAAPMRYRNLFLAGDAAHIVPPTGAKGLNLAIADVVRLAEALHPALRLRRRARASTRYSDDCLARVWRAQHFSWWMTQMLHVDLPTMHTETSSRVHRYAMYATQGPPRPHLLRTTSGCRSRRPWEAESVAQLVSLSEAIAETVHDGDSVALEGFTHLIPFAAGHEVLRQGRRELELIRMTPDILYDQMIGVGAARKLVFSYGGNPGVGSLHRFRDAIEHGWPRAIEVEEHSPRRDGEPLCRGCVEAAVHGHARLQRHRSAGAHERQAGDLPVHRGAADGRAGSESGRRDRSRPGGRP